MDWPTCNDYRLWLETPSRYVSPELSRWMPATSPSVARSDEADVLLFDHPGFAADAEVTVRLWHAGATPWDPAALISSWNTAASIGARDHHAMSAPPSFLIRVLAVIPHAIGDAEGTRFPAIVHECVRGTRLDEWQTSDAVDDRGSWESLYAQALDLIRWLAQNGASHGQLQPRQLLVTDAGVLRVTNFDTFQIGSATVTGHSSDYRSALYLLASLKAASLDESLSLTGVACETKRGAYWPTAAELASPWTSKALEQMLSAESTDLRELTRRLVASFETRSDDLPSLAEANSFFARLARPDTQEITSVIGGRDVEVDIAPAPSDERDDASPAVSRGAEKWVAEEDDDVAGSIAFRLPTLNGSSRDGLIEFTGLEFVAEDLVSTWRQAAAPQPHVTPPPPQPPPPRDALSGRSSVIEREPSGLRADPPREIPDPMPSPTGPVVSDTKNRRRDEQTTGMADGDDAGLPADSLMAAIARGDGSAARQLFSPEHCRGKIRDGTYDSADCERLIEWARANVRDLDYLDFRPGPFAYRRPVDGFWQLVWHGPRAGFCDDLVVCICRERPPQTAVPSETTAEFTNHWELTSHTAGMIAFRPEWSGCFIVLWAVTTLAPHMPESTLYSYPLVLEKPVPEIPRADSATEVNGNAARKNGFFGKVLGKLFGGP